MGCDIYGYIEVCEHPPEGSWSAVADAGSLIGRDSAVFGCLFGMGGNHLFEPLFHARGLPGDCDPGTRNALEEGTAGWSWFTLAELRTVDLDAESESTFVARFRVGEDGAEELDETFACSPLSRPYQAPRERRRAALGRPGLPRCAHDAARGAGRPRGGPGCHGESGRTPWSGERPDRRRLRFLSLTSGPS